MVYAQQTRLLLSKHSDFSSDDRTFKRTDILYAKVIAPHINPSDLDKNRFKLSPLQGSEDIETSFRYTSNGAFTTQIALASIGGTQTLWEVEARLEDENEREFRQKVNITILTDDGSSDDGSGDGGSSDDGSSDDGSGDDGSSDDGSGDDGSSDDGSSDDGSSDDGSSDDGSSDDGSGDDGSSDDGSGDDGSSDDGSSDDGSSDDGSSDDGSGDDSDDDGSDDNLGAANLVAVSGLIESVNIETITVEETVFTILPSTSIISDSQANVPIEWLKVGSEVTVTGLQSQENTIRAERITLHMQTGGHFQLHQNYPNPFASQTTIQFDLFESEPANVHLAVYDVLGRELISLVNEELGTGRYRVAWSPAVDTAPSPANGIYFVRLVINGFTQTRQMTIQR